MIKRFVFSIAFTVLLIITSVSDPTFKVADMDGEGVSARLREKMTIPIESHASQEFIIGVDGMPFESYASLLSLVETWGGEITNDVYFGGKIEAVVIDLPSISVSLFLEEVMKAFEPNYLHPNEQFKIDFIPNDPLWTWQWGPTKIDTDVAWNTTVGDSSILLAVVDTGIDWDHPDLAPNYLPLGYDWVNEDSDPMDDHGHGTHVAGIAAAVINNSIGIAGISQVRIMAEKALNQTGYGFSDDLAEAIIHAADQSADIISMSWGSHSYNLLIQHAIQYAYNSGVLLVAAAGNNATNEKCYPAAYDEVIAVSATDRNDNIAYFSNYGEWIELAAPGVSIYSTTWNNDYAYKSGTSMATPHVSGVAALIWSVFPNMTHDQVRTQLQETVEDLGSSGFDIFYGYGRINASRAVQTETQIHDISINNVTIYKDVVHQGGSLPINVTVQNKGNYTETFNLTVDANTTLITTRNMTLAAGNSHTLCIIWNTTGIAKGSYIIKVIADILPGETYSLDNNFTEGPINIVITGDVTGREGFPDGKCDMMDVGFVAKYYSNDVPPAPSQCDLTGSTPGVPDGKIDMRDLGVVAGHFGDTD